MHDHYFWANSGFFVKCKILDVYLYCVFVSSKIGRRGTVGNDSRFLSNRESSLLEWRIDAIEPSQ